MKRQKVGTLLVATFLTCNLGVAVLPSWEAHAAVNNTPSTYSKDAVKDFKNKEKEAREYAKTLPIHQDQILATRSEKTAFEAYVERGPGMNEVLRTGKSSQEPVTKKMLEAYTKEFTPTMDSVFKKPQAKLPVGLQVYRYTNELQFGFELGTFFQNEKVNQSGIEKFKKQFEGKTFHDKGFTSTSLALVNLPPGSLGNAERFASRTIRMDIKVPKGSPAVYLDNLYAEVVLPRDSNFKINKVSGIVEKGKLIMKIDVELIQKN